MIAERRKGILSMIIFIFIIVVIGIFLVNNQELLLSLQNVSKIVIVGLIVLRILFFATNGLFLKVFAEKFNVHLAIKEWFGLAIVTTLGNYVTPFSGGLIARATYLKRRYAFPYSQFATLLTSNYLVNFWVIGLVGTIISSILFFNTDSVSWIIISFFLVVVFSISIIISLPTGQLPGNNRIIRNINTALLGWSLVKGDKTLVGKLVLLAVVNILLNGISFWLAYYALGVDTTVMITTLLSLIMSFSILIQITPGNLGVREAVVSLSSGLLGVGAAEGLLASLIIRTVTVMIIFVLGPIFSYIFARDIMN